MNLSTIRPFFIQAEAVPDRGEDSGFVCCYENGLVVTGVFDGCGGIGGRRYPEVNGRTGAYIGSQVAAFAADAFFKKYYSEKGKDFIVGNRALIIQHFQQLQEYISGKLANVKKKLTQTGGLQVGGSLSKSFPTTVSIIASMSNGNCVYCNYLWAGDSRGYILDENGLYQVTADDIDTNADDAFLNLREDGILTNVASGDGAFKLHNSITAIQRPSMLINATDGCFAYFLTPMDFENVILQTLEESTSPVQWQARLRDRIKAVAGDDFTLAISCFGFDDFEDMKKHYSLRQIYVQKNYIERQNGADEEQLKQLWESYKPAYYDRDNITKLGELK